MAAFDQPVDKIVDTSPAKSPDKILNQNKQETGKTLTLILVITLAAIVGVVIVLVAIAVGLNKVSFSEAKDILSLILVAIGSLTGAAIGFYFGSLSRFKPKD